MVSGENKKYAQTVGYEIQYIPMTPCCEALGNLDQSRKHRDADGDNEAGAARIGRKSQRGHCAKGEEMLGFVPPVEKPGRQRISWQQANYRGGNAD